MQWSHFKVFTFLYTGKQMNFSCKVDNSYHILQSKMSYSSLHYLNVYDLCTRVQMMYQMTVIFCVNWSLAAKVTCALQPREMCIFLRISFVTKNPFYWWVVRRLWNLFDQNEHFSSLYCFRLSSNVQHLPCLLAALLSSIRQDKISILMPTIFLHH